MKSPLIFKPSGKYPVEIFVSVLRESAPSDTVRDTPESIVAYWRQNIESKPDFRADKEQVWGIYLNARRRVIAHELIGMGIVDQVIVHSRELFRSAIVASAHTVVMIHNHPSGDTTPSESDIRMTRDMIRAGQCLKIDLLDSLIVAVAQEGKRGFTSLRELGYFSW